jgi:hypothetical protein
MRTETFLLPVPGLDRATLAQATEGGDRNNDPVPRQKTTMEQDW